jgi:hypothetical protein
MKFLRGTGTAAFLFLGTMLPVYAQHDEKAGEKKAAPAQQHAQQPRQQQQHAQQPKPQESQRAQQPKPQHTERAQQPRQAQPERAQQPKPQQTQRAQPAKQQDTQRAQQASKQQATQRAQPPTRQQETQRAQQVAPQQSQQMRQQPQRSQQQARTWQQQRGWTQQGGGWRGNATWQGDRSQNWASDHRSWEQRGGYGGYYIPQATFGISFGSQHFFRIRSRPVIFEGYPRFQYGGFSFLLVDPWPQDWSEDWYANDDVYIDYDDGYYLYNRSYPEQRLAITIAL